MAYCQECGSEVAKEDIYCPFCGIALQFPVTEGKSENASSPIEVANGTAEAALAEPIAENAEEWEITPIKQTETPVSNLFNQSFEEVDPNAVTVVERTKKPIEVVESPERDSFEPVDEINDLTEVDGSAVSEEFETVNKTAEAELANPEILKTESEDKPKDTEPETSVVLENDFLTESESEAEVENKSKTEQQTDEIYNQAAEKAENTEISTITDVDERNFEEQFEKIIERSKSGNLVENESDISGIQEQIVESLSEDNMLPSIADPFDSTVAYTSVDVKELKLANDADKDLTLFEDEADFTETTNQESVAEEIKPEELKEESVDADKYQEAESGFVSTEIEELKHEEVSAEQTLIEIAEKEVAEIAENNEPEPKAAEIETVLDSAVPVVAAPVIAENVPVEEVKERYTSQVGDAVDTGGGKSKLKPLSEGTVLNGRYEIVRKIGGGGMGAVYLASDRNLGGVLRAVKEMVQSHIEESHQDKAVNDFKRESLLLTSLEHPSIPTIYDYFFDDRENRFYLVMKYISGGDLAGRLRSAPENRLDEKTITEWAIQVADVLDYLHNRTPPIVYRDLKPSNVMIDGNSGRVMLIDFGIARWVSAKEEKGVTAVGTMGYAPPELFSGNVEPRSDIYSLGSTMFHLLTGADPQNSPLLIFDFNKNPRPRQINSMLSDQMEQILLRSVEYDADKRFANAAEMREVLINHLDNIRTGKLTFGVNDGISAVGFVGGQMVFCGFCGQKIVSSDMFCPFCGAKQATGQMSASSPIPQSVYNVQSITAKLHLLGTNDLDSVTYNLEKDNNLIGRRDPMSNIFPEVDLSKYDPQTKISRRHARLWREGDTFMVEDLGSSNGTVLLTAFNEQLRLLPHQPRVIAHGDKIKIGDTTLHFVVG